MRNWAERLWCKSGGVGLELGLGARAGGSGWGSGWGLGLGLDGWFSPLYFIRNLFNVFFGGAQRFFFLEWARRGGDTPMDAPRHGPPEMFLEISAKCIDFLHLSRISRDFGKLAWSFWRRMPLCRHSRLSFFATTTPPPPPTATTRTSMGFGGPSRFSPNRWHIWVN
jgi:hypothetical protein